MPVPADLSLTTCAKIRRQKQPGTDPRTDKRRDTGSGRGTGTGDAGRSRCRQGRQVPLPVPDHPLAGIGLLDQPVMPPDRTADDRKTCSERKRIVRPEPDDFSGICDPCWIFTVFQRPGSAARPRYGLPLQSTRENRQDPQEGVDTDNILTTVHDAFQMLLIGPAVGRK